MTQAQSATNLAYQGRVQSSFNCLSAIGVLLTYALLDQVNQQWALPHLFGFDAVLTCLAIILVVCYFKVLPARD